MQCSKTISNSINTIRSFAEIEFYNIFKIICYNFCDDFFTMTKER